MVPTESVKILVVSCAGCQATAPDLNDCRNCGRGRVPVTSEYFDYTPVQIPNEQAPRKDPFYTFNRKRDQRRQLFKKGGKR